MRLLLRCLLLANDLRNIYIGIGRVNIEVLREYYTRRRRIRSWLHRLWVWFLAAASDNSWSRFNDLNHFGAWQILQDTLLRVNLGYRLTFPFEGLVVKRVLGHSLYL